MPCSRPRRRSPSGSAARRRAMPAMRQARSLHRKPARSASLFMPEQITVGELTARFLEACGVDTARSEEHTSELQSLMRISYAVYCLKKKKKDKARLTIEHE